MFPTPSPRADGARQETFFVARPFLDAGGGFGGIVAGRSGRAVCPPVAPSLFQWHRISDGAIDAFQSRLRLHRPLVQRIDGGDQLRRLRRHRMGRKARRFWLRSRPSSFAARSARLSPRRPSWGTTTCRFTGRGVGTADPSYLLSPIGGAHAQRLELKTPWYYRGHGTG